MLFGQAEKTKHQHGFSVIELLIALAIATIVVSGITGLMIQSMRYVALSEHRWQATTLGSGAVEALTNLKEQSWATFSGYATDGRIYKLQQSGGNWLLVESPSGETLGMFTRRISLAPVCRSGATNELVPCGGGATVDPDSRKVIVNVAWTEQGKEQSINLEEYLDNWEVCYVNWPYTYGADYTYDADKIEVTGGLSQLIDRTASAVPNGDFQTGDFTNWTVQGNAWQVVNSGGGNFVASTEADSTRLGSIQSSVFTSAGQQLRFRHRGWSQMTTSFPAGTFTDDNKTQFDTGTYADTEYNNVSHWLQLTAAGMASGTSTYTSAIKDAGSAKPWKTMAWLSQRPTDKELPNSAQTETDYPSGAVNMSGNMLLFHFNEDSGTLGDSSGRSNNGTNQGATYGLSGKFNTALNFNGVSNRVAVDQNSSLDLTSSGSVEAWIHLDSYKNFGGIIHKGTKADLSDESYSLQLWDNGRVALKLVDGAGGSHTLQSNTSVSDGQWYHVTGTWDGSGMKIYFNGQMDNSNGSTITARTTNSELNVGAQLGENVNPTVKNYPFAGRIDEAAIFNRALSVTEINDHYERGILHLRYQVRSCDDAACVGETFIGPDGTGSTFYSEQSNSVASFPSLALSHVSNNRYFQYRVVFVTDVNSLTPELIKVTAGDFPTNGQGNNYVALFRASNNEELQRVDAANSASWGGVIMNLGEYANQPVYLRVVDNSAQAVEGWYSVDDFRQTDSAGNPIQGYATDGPPITPKAAKTVTGLTKWYSFSADSSGTGIVYYQLSNDGGQSWLYWNGSAWALAGATNYNTEAEVNSHLAAFPTTGTTISVKAFLVSVNNTQPVVLDKAIVAYEGQCGI